MAELLSYNFDEASGDVIDHTGNSRGFAIASPGIRTSSGNGQTDKGLTLSFNGIQNGPAITGLQTANRTVMCHVKNTGVIIGHLLEMYVTSLDSSAWSILYLNGNLNIQARNSSGFVRPSVTRPSDNAWHHVAGTYDGTNVRLWLDGSNVATAAMAPPLRTDANVFRIMDNVDSVTTIDNVRLFDTALDSTAINTYMNTPVTAPAAGPNVYFHTGAQASGVYEMTAGGILVQRNNLITIKT